MVLTASRDQLLLLSARELRSQSLAYLLPSSGNKAALADHLYHYFHTSNQVPNNLHCATTAVSLLQPTDGNLSHTDHSISTHNSLHANCWNFFITSRQLHCKVPALRRQAFLPQQQQPHLTTNPHYKRPPVINYLQHFLSIPINRWTRYCLQPLPFSRCYP